MSEEVKPPVPDYGSTTVYSNDLVRGVNMLLEKHGGVLDEALTELFRTGGTTYDTARQQSVIFAPLFGLTEVEFMKKHRNWKLARPMSPS